MRYCASPGVPMSSCEFSMHPNWPLVETIYQSRAVLCIIYDIKSAFVVDSPIPYVLNVIASNQPRSEVRYSFKSTLECHIIIMMVSLLIII